MIDRFGIYGYSLLSSLHLFFVTIVFISGSSCLLGSGITVVFEDDFGSGSRGELHPNMVVEPPPIGMGYRTKILAGYVLNKWIISDIEADGPRRSFWVIPENEDGNVATYMEQAGRSRNSIAFAGVSVPDTAIHYVVEFKQRAHDNDYIGFIIGASSPEIEHNGVEFGYERQIPGTDDSTDDIYYRSPWGRGRITLRSYQGHWIDHRIEVRGEHISWSQNGEVMLAGSVEALKQGGWFGIRQRYERGTRYDDVRITVLASEAALK